MRVNRKRAVKNINYYQIFKYAALFSVVLGFIGSLSYLYFRGVRNSSLEEDKKRLEELRREREGRLYGEESLRVSKKDITVSAGTETSFDVRLVDENSMPILAPKDLIVRISQEPFTNSFQYFGDSGNTIVIKKDDSGTTIRYMETKAGAYKLFVSVDSYGGAEISITVLSAALDVINIEAPDLVTISTAKSGFIIRATAQDKFGNLVKKELEIFVQKNTQDAQSLGVGLEKTFFDVDAAECDRYVFSIQENSKKASKTVVVKQQGSIC